MRKQETDTLDESWLWIKILLILVIVFAFLSDTNVLYFLQAYGVSMGSSDILTIAIVSGFPNIEVGDYANYYRDNGDSVIHKVRSIKKDYVIFENIFGELEWVSKDNVRGKVLLDIPIIRLDDSRDGFMTACYYENYHGGFDMDCDYLYCKGVQKRSQEDCLE